MSPARRPGFTLLEVLAALALAVGLLLAGLAWLAGGSAEAGARAALRETLAGALRAAAAEGRARGEPAAARLILAGGGEILAVEAAGLRRPPPTRVWLVAWQGGGEPPTAPSAEPAELLLPSTAGPLELALARAPSGAAIWLRLRVDPDGTVQELPSE